MSKSNLLEVQSECVKQQRPVLNFCTETLVRCVYYGASVNETCGPAYGTFQEAFEWLEWVTIGIADERGFRFHPSTNSQLILRGFHPTAMLTYLTHLRFNGEPVVAQNSAGELIALHGAVVQLCGLMIHPRYNQYLLEGYRKTGKPETFA